MKDEDGACEAACKAKYKDSFKALSRKLLKLIKLKRRRAFQGTDGSGLGTRVLNSRESLKCRKHSNLVLKALSNKKDRTIQDKLLSPQTKITNSSSTRRLTPSFCSREAVWKAIKCQKCIRITLNSWPRSKHTRTMMKSSLQLHNCPLRTFSSFSNYWPHNSASHSGM